MIERREVAKLIAEEVRKVNSNKEEEKISVLAGFLFHWKLHSQPYSLIIQSMIASGAATEAEIHSAIKLYTECKYCLSDQPVETGRYLRSCIVRA